MKTPRFAVALDHRPTDPGELTDVAEAHLRVVHAKESDLSSRADVTTQLRRALGVSGEVEKSSVEALRAIGDLERP